MSVDLDGRVRVSVVVLDCSDAIAEISIGSASQGCAEEIVPSPGKPPHVVCPPSAPGGSSNGEPPMGEPSHSVSPTGGAAMVAAVPAATAPAAAPPQATLDSKVTPVGRPTLPSSPVAAGAGGGGGGGEGDGASCPATGGSTRDGTPEVAASDDGRGGATTSAWLHACSCCGACASAEPPGCWQGFAPSSNELPRLANIGARPFPGAGKGPSRAPASIANVLATTQGLPRRNGCS
mmetsp:Transcript_95577/g.265547  ORF Transcript_95577/g.265547 Transcript_95577/m.265547 type:complete len:235 (+) Transcript_95577:869-1573(+)